MQVSRAALGLGTFYTAKATLMGIELVCMIRKGQVRPLADGADTQQFRALAAWPSAGQGPRSSAALFATEPPAVLSIAPPWRRPSGSTVGRTVAPVLAETAVTIAAERAEGRAGAEATGPVAAWRIMVPHAARAGRSCGLATDRRAVG